MKPPALPAVLAGILGLALSSCATVNPTAPAAPREPARAQEEGVIVGETTREQIEEALPEWAQAEAASTPDPEACRALAAVEPGAEVTVFLGTWCGDSRREVPRLWKALDLAGPAVPFEIRYVGVDRKKQEPVGEVNGNGIRYVPTFIVHRNGREVGRIVEHSPGGVEKDLLALLTGQAQGLITTRTDLH
jgi:hypothetical protein